MQKLYKSLITFTIAQFIVFITSIHGAEKAGSPAFGWAEHKMHNGWHYKSEQHLGSPKRKGGGRSCGRCLQNIIICNNCMEKNYITSSLNQKSSFFICVNCGESLNQDKSAYGNPTEDFSEISTDVLDPNMPIPPEKEEGSED
jgi:hypothetical protein